MENKLELKKEHLSVYYPYKLEVTYQDCLSEKKVKAYLTGITDKEVETTYKRKRNGVHGDLISWKGNNSVKDLNFKLRLIPLSDFNGKIAKVLMDKYNCSLEIIKEVWELDWMEIDFPNITVKTYEMMCREHIDFNDLIGKGLAEIKIN